MRALAEATDLACCIHESEAEWLAAAALVAARAIGVKSRATLIAPTGSACQFLRLTCETTTLRTALSDGKLSVRAIRTGAGHPQCQLAEALETTASAAQRAIPDESPRWVILDARVFPSATNLRRAMTRAREIADNAEAKLTCFFERRGYSAEELLEELSYWPNVIAGSRFIANPQRLGRREGTAETLLNEFLARLRASADDVVGRRVSFGDAPDHSCLVRRACEYAADPIVITNARGRIEFVNAAFTRETGYQAADALNRTPRTLRLPGGVDVSFRHMWRVLAAGQSWRGVVEAHAADGAPRRWMLSASPVFDERGVIAGYIGIPSPA